MGGANLGVAHPSHDVWRITVIGSHSNLTFITGSGSLRRRAVACRFGAETGGLAHHRRLKGQGLGLRWSGFEAESGLDNLGSRRRNRFLITAFPAFSGKYSSWAAEMWTG